MILCKLIQFVNQIDKKELGRKLSREMRPPREVKDMSAEAKHAVTLLVVNDSLVVDLRGSETELVIQIRRSRANFLYLVEVARFPFANLFLTGVQLR